MARIYLLTNLVNGKKYVGFTSQKPEKYLARYSHDSKIIKTSNRPIYKAIRKYGIANFKIEVLEEHSDPEYALKVLEPKYITLHRSLVTENGYNITVGGEGTFGYRHKPTAKILLANKAFERPLPSEETRGKMSVTRSKSWLVVFPDGAEKFVDRLPEFCEENG